MKRLFRPLLATLLLGLVFLPQAVWARSRNNHPVHHHKVRHVKHHHHHRAGA
ncbi:MAG: hypothetical protein ACRD3L_04880 [Terriglobales bacterium]